MWHAADDLQELIDWLGKAEALARKEEQCAEQGVQMKVAESTLPLFTFVQSFQTLSTLHKQTNSTFLNILGATVFYSSPKLLQYKGYTSEALWASWRHLALLKPFIGLDSTALSTRKKQRRWRDSLWVQREGSLPCIKKFKLYVSYQFLAPIIFGYLLFGLESLGGFVFFISVSVTWVLGLGWARVCLTGV